MKYIQSFHQYPVTFSTVDITIPAKNAQGESRNICEVSEEKLEKLQNGEPLFRALVNKKRYRILNKMPESYKPAARQINEALAEAEKAKKELEAAKAELAQLKGTTENVEPTVTTEPTVTEPTNTEPTVTEKKAIEDMTYPELQAAVKALGGSASGKKDELIKFLKEKETESTAK